MDIHFNDTRPANAPASTLFEVLTDYTHYPSFNSALVNVASPVSRRGAGRPPQAACGPGWEGVTNSF